MTLRSLTLLLIMANKEHHLLASSDRISKVYFMAKLTNLLHIMITWLHVMTLEHQ